MAFLNLPMRSLGPKEVMARICASLKAKVVVFQGPPSFAPTSENKKNLKKFFKSVSRKDHSFVWEPRGKWRQDQIQGLCKELDLIHCVDPFKSSPSYGKFNYLRLHGKDGYRHRYSSGQLKGLLSFLKAHAPKPQVYLLFNNTFMFQDALRFTSMVSYIRGLRP